MPTTKRDLQALAYCQQCRRAVNGPRRLRRGKCGTCYQHWLDQQPGSLKRSLLERHKCPHCEVTTTEPNLRRHIRSRHPEVAS